MSAETAADSEQKDEVLFVCQHSSKPLVISCAAILLTVRSTKIDCSHPPAQ
ncbi:MAG: hypothetical protein WKG06_29145 [Segetibacter sp.]